MLVFLMHSQMARDVFVYFIYSGENYNLPLLILIIGKRLS